MTSHLPPTKMPTDRKRIYSCFLTDGLGYLTPNRIWNARRILPQMDELTIISPEECYSRVMTSIPEIYGPLREVYGGAGLLDLVWYNDPDIGTPFPYNPSKGYSRTLSLIRNGNSVPSAEDTKTLHTLYLAGGVAVDRELQERKASQHSLILRDQQQMLTGFAKLESLISPLHLAQLRIYYRRLTRLRRFTKGDPQSSLRLVRHNEPVAKLLHHLIAPRIGTILGKEIKPSYCYSAVYLEGAELPIHIDREQCEYSVTFCVDSTPEPDSQIDWPIHLVIGNRTESVDFAVGEALVYQGRQQPHYRNELLQGRTATFWTSPIFTDSGFGHRSVIV
jgi:hypothetical protein